MKLTNEVIDTIYTELADATKAYTERAFAHTKIEQDLKAIIAEATASGHITGKNQQLRDAAAREMFGDKFHALEGSALFVASDKLRLDLAKIEIERAKMTLRVMELSA